MGRRDYEMEAGGAIRGRPDHRVDLRAMIVGSAGSNDGTLGGAGGRRLGSAHESADELAARRERR
jgi:hypothetical protein